MRLWIGLFIGAVVGGLIGYSKLLCPDGTCAITGSWFGGAILGGGGGFFVSSMLPMGRASVDTSPPDDADGA